MMNGWKQRWRHNAPRHARGRAAKLGLRSAVFVIAVLFSPSAWAQSQAARSTDRPEGLGFRYQPVGTQSKARPRITNVQIVDLDRDGLQDVVVCDAQAQTVFWCRQLGDGEWDEQPIGENLIAPAHATVVDLDQDDDLDVVVSVMGNIYPDDGVIGSLVLLENEGGRFAKRTLLDDVRRVVDAQPADFDGDGDLDLAVAVFGYARGKVLWLENRGDLQFRDHELLYAPGTIHVPVADYDGDGDLDIAAIVSQDEEEAWGFENLGGGKFKARLLWTTPNYDIGSAGLVNTDLDGDGDIDLLLPVGDNLEDSYSIPQPYHGCLWLENQGDWKFRSERIATFPGAYAADAADLDSDGDQDVVLCSMVNDWDAPGSASVVWLENDGRQIFRQRTVAQKPIMLTTIACGDLNADGRPDVVAGGLHLFRPFNRLGRVSSWINTESASARTVDVTGDSDSNSELDAVPLPDLTQIDPLTGGDLKALYEKVSATASGAGPTTSDWVDLGKAYYAFGFFDESKTCFAKGVASDKKSFDANYWLGVALSRLAELTAAVDQFQSTLTIATSPQKSQVWYEIGRCWLRLEDAKRAERAFVQAGAFDPALYQLAKLRIRAKRPSSAERPMNSLARRQRGTTELLMLSYRMATAIEDRHQQETFRDRSEYNSKKMPLDPVAAVAKQIRNDYGIDKLGRKAERLVRQKNWDEAAPLLRRIVDADQDKDAVLLLATVEIERGRPREAIERLKALMAEQGDFPQGMYLLGKAYRAAGDSARAEKIWLATAKLRSVGELHQQLATLYAGQGREAEARQQRALAAQATGIAGLRHGNPSGAMRFLQRAVDLDDTLADAWFYLGECQRFVRQLHSSRESYRKVLELEPNHGRAAAALEKLSS